MSSFDERAKEWDKPERVEMACAISMCMLSGLRLDRSMTAIDFGAGTGLITLEIAKKAGHVIAIDSSEGMLGVLREKVSLSAIKNVTVMAADMEKDLKQGPVDVIVSSMTIHHVQDIPALAVKLFAMLKPGGQLAIADLEKEDGSFHGEGNKMGVKHHGFERNVLEQAFSRAGFKGIRFTTAYKAKRNSRVFPIFLMLAEKQ